MKKTILSILIIFAIVLAGCSSLTSGISLGSTQTDNEPSTATQLVVGTLKLEGTDEDVTTEQAQELLFLWQVYDEVSQSDTTAQEEIDGLVDQIQENMTAEQMQAIDNMGLTQQDVSAALQEANIASSNSSSSNSNTSNVSSVPSGDMAGGMPLDGGGAPAGGDMPVDFGTGQTISTGQAEVAQAGSSLESSDEAPSVLVEALIQSLEQKLA